MAKSPTESISPEEVEAVRSEVRQIVEAEGIRQTIVAEEAGIPYGTFTPWLGGTYKGDNAGLALKVRRWLETRRERGRTHAVLPQAPKFVLTHTASKIMDVLGFAQSAPDFAVVVAGDDIGSSNVFVVTAEPCLASPNNMLSALADAIRITEKRSVYLSRAIADRLRNAAALVVIDEGQHLSSQALDQLRTLHDKASVGIVVAGNESVYSRLQGAERNAQFAQLYSRVGMRMTQPKARARDICALIEAWGITDQRVIGLLKLIAAKPGALRLMTKVIRLATMLAAGEGEPMGERQVKLAWAQLSATPLETTA
ncbi:MAG: AAA family ATPase [Rhizobiales bacterium]|nr:AAA family ATPase [Hyphomicrobiales bacterium]